MGLMLYDAAILAHVCQEKKLKKTVVCLGEPHLYLTAKSLFMACNDLKIKFPESLDPKDDGKLTGERFFKALGFEEYMSLDYDEYEGSQIIHDLNNPDLPEKYHGITDFIYDTGTFEHVFKLTNGFSCIHKLLRNEGMVFHTNPSNGYLDHGFYQISPTLYYDYYRKNNYEIISAHIFDHSKRGVTYCEPYANDVYRTKGTDYPLKRLARASVSFCAQKTEQSTFGEIPIQSYYSDMHSEFSQEYQSKYSFSLNSFSLKMWIISFIGKDFKATIKKMLG